MMMKISKELLAALCVMWSVFALHAFHIPFAVIPFFIFIIVGIFSILFEFKDWH